jgi:hypothetical protein
MAAAGVGMAAAAAGTASSCFPPPPNRDPKKPPPFFADIDLCTNLLPRFTHGALLGKKTSDLNF